MALTQSEVIQKLKTDPIFALNFAFDNNADGVMAALSDSGYPTPSDIIGRQQREDYAYNVMLNLLKTNKPKAIEVISKVPYNKSDSAPAYTQGLLDFFMREQPASTTTPQGRFSLDALLGGLGVGLSTYSGLSLSNEGTGTGTAGTGLSAAEIKKQEDELAAEKKKRTNMIIGFSALGLFILGVIIYIATRKKKN